MLARGSASCIYPLGSAQKAVEKAGGVRGIRAREHSTERVFLPLPQNFVLIVRVIRTPSRSPREGKDGQNKILLHLELCGKWVYFILSPRGFIQGMTLESYPDKQRQTEIPPGK